jgi:hypothetical protein
VAMEPGVDLGAGVAMVAVALVRIWQGKPRRRLYRMPAEIPSVDKNWVTKMVEGRNRSPLESKERKLLLAECLSSV